jgi:superfamily II RNA helicase
MTTEILMNTLFRNIDSDSGLADAVAVSGNTCIDLQEFQIDITTELACVVFDEIHYINDPHRGHVWEKTLMMLPKHVQLLMLSATIDQPENFAKWCETHRTKPVILCNTDVRVVPLSHYAFVATTETAFKKIKDKPTQQEIRQTTHRLLPLQTASGQFNDANYANVQKTLQRLTTAQIDIKRKFVMNKLLEHLKQENLTPAIAFLFSRKQVELCAKEMTTILLEDDSKIPYTVRKECETILRNKLTNFAEYMQLPEYEFLISLLEKGVGIHHSGMIPVFREIVELFISKKYIKLLFATESFAIGLDCPIKSAIFMSLIKFDGTEERFLQSHEYTQMAGRAGRRGIDTIGYAIHCNNLFKLPTLLDYKKLLCGKPQKFISKIAITPHLVLTLLQTKTEPEIEDFIGKSLLGKDIGNSLQQTQQLIDESQKKAEELNNRWQIPTETCEKWVQLQTELKYATHKKTKEIAKKMTALKQQTDEAVFKESVKQFVCWKDQQQVAVNHQNNLLDITQTIKNAIANQTAFLRDFGAISTDNTLTESGTVACEFHEIDGLVASHLLQMTSRFANWTTVQIVSFLSCFTDVRLPQDSALNPQSPQHIEDPELKLAFTESAIYQNQMKDTLQEKTCMTTTEQPFHSLLINLLPIWCEKCNTDMDCRWFIQEKLGKELDVSIGDFVKIVLKMIAMTKELERFAILHNDIGLQHKLSQIEGLVSKYIMTSQSLYL